MSVQWSIEGDYMEACSCDYLCPCILENATTPATHDFCKVGMTYVVRHGRFGALDLTGSDRHVRRTRGVWCPTTIEHAIKPRQHPISTDKFEHIEDARTRGLPHHRHPRRVNEWAGLHAARVGERASGTLLECPLAHARFNPMTDADERDDRPYSPAFGAPHHVEGDSRCAGVSRAPRI